MTKEEIKKALEEEYIVALGVFAEYISTFDEKEQEEELYNLDDTVWAVAEECDLTDAWLDIFSALQSAI